MNDEMPDWHRGPNPNEARILNIFLESKCSDLVSRAYLERRLCKTRLMNQRTLTDRISYLVEKGYVEKIIGDKGAVFYAPRPMIDMASTDSTSKHVIDAAIDNASPKIPLILSMPVRVDGVSVSDAEEWGLLVQVAQTWEKEGTGSRRQKAAYYRELQRLRKELVRRAEMTR